MGMHKETILRRTVRDTSITRITTCYESLDKNFELLDSALDEISSDMTDETGSKARGFQRQLWSFDTLFASEVAMLVFQLTDDCSKLVQKVAASVLDSQYAVQMLPLQLLTASNGAVRCRVAGQRNPFARETSGHQWRILLVPPA